MKEYEKHIEDKYPAPERDNFPEGVDGDASYEQAHYDASRNITKEYMSTKKAYKQAAFDRGQALIAEASKQIGPSMEPLQTDTKEARGPTAATGASVLGSNATAASKHPALKLLNQKRRR